MPKLKEAVALYAPSATPINLFECRDAHLWTLEGMDSARLQVGVGDSDEDDSGSGGSA